MLLILIELAITAWFAFMLGGFGHFFLRRFIVLNLGVIAFFALMLLTMLVEEICGTHPHIGPTCAITAALGLAMLGMVAIREEGRRRLHRMWTPE